MTTTTTNEVNIASPCVLERFIGNRNIVERVQVALEAAWEDGGKFPHALMVGPPGLGKTLLATIIAREMGCELREQIGQNFGWCGNLAGFLLEPDDREVALIDEIDTLPVPGQIVLYKSLEDRKVFPEDGGMQSEERAIAISDFTMLACSNNEHELLRPLLDRFRLILRFEYYNESELVELLSQRCQMLQWQVEEDVLKQIAVRGRGTPRLALRLLESCRRTARSEGADMITVAHFLRTVTLEGIDRTGLDTLEQRYLKILAEFGGTVRLHVIAQRLGLPPRTLSSVVENYLIREGLINCHPEGRVLTPKGHEYLRESS